jgi:hypothetical protein
MLPLSIDNANNNQQRLNNLIKLYQLKYNNPYLFFNNNNTADNKNNNPIAGSAPKPPVINFPDHYILSNNPNP